MHMIDPHMQIIKYIHVMAMLVIRLKLMVHVVMVIGIQELLSDL